MAEMRFIADPVKGGGVWEVENSGETHSFSKHEDAEDFLEGLTHEHDYNLVFFSVGYAVMECSCGDYVEQVS